MALVVTLEEGSVLGVRLCRRGKAMKAGWVPAPLGIPDCVIERGSIDQQMEDGPDLPAGVGRSGSVCWLFHDVNRIDEELVHRGLADTIRQARLLVMKKVYLGGGKIGNTSQKMKAG